MSPGRKTTRSIPPRSLGRAAWACMLLAGTCLGASADPAASDGWAFTFTPYLWSVRLDGGIGTTLEGFDVDVELTERFDPEDLVLATYANLEWSRGRAGVTLDTVYARVGAGVNSQVPPEVAAGLDSTLYLVEVSGTWALLERRPFDAPGRPGAGNARVSILAGARFIHLETDVAVSVDPVTVLVGLDSADIGYPMVGMRFDAGLTDRVSASVRADAMWLSDDSAWQVAGGLRLNNRIDGSESSVFVGYRVINHKIESGSSRYDITAEGFVLGWSIVFK